MTTFHPPVNDATADLGARVAAARSAGSPTVTVVDGALYGTAFPIFATAARAGVTLAIFEVTGRTGNVLTVSGAVDGTTDVALQVDDAFEPRPNRIAMTEVHDAVHALEAIGWTGTEQRWMQGDGVTGVRLSAIGDGTTYIQTTDDGFVGHTQTPITVGPYAAGSLLTFAGDVTFTGALVILGIATAAFFSLPQFPGNGGIYNVTRRDTGAVVYGLYSAAGDLAVYDYTTGGNALTIAATTHAATFAGDVTATSFAGDGSALTGLTSTQVSGLGTMAVQAASGVAITGGAIDGVTLGAVAPVQSQAYRPINAQSGTTYVFAASDNGKLVTFSSGSPATATVPPDFSTAFPVGAEIGLLQLGAGAVTVAPGAGVAVNAYQSILSLAGQYAGATLKKTDVNTWVFLGATGGTSGSSGGGFDPTSLPLAYWAKAGAGNSQDSAGTTPSLNGDVVGRLADQSSTGLVASTSVGHEFLRRYDADWCWVLDAASYLSTAYHAAIDFDRTSSFSLEVAFRPNFTGAGPFGVVERLSSNSSFAGYALRVTQVGADYRLQFHLINNFGSGNRIEVVGSTSLINGTYYHVVATYSGTGAAGGVKIYVNGAAETPTVNSDGLTGAITNTNGLMIGHSNDLGLKCPSRMRFVRLYSAALTPLQVSQLVTYASSPHAAAPPALPAATTPVPLILDTDYGDDVGDAHAVEMVHRLADAGYITLIGMVSTTTTEAAPGALEGINGYFSRSSLPLGAWKGSNFGVPDNYATTVRTHFAISKVRSDYPDGSATYRQALAAAANGSVAIVAVGMLDNLAALLQTAADGFSPLAGPALVAAKVKALYAMGGDYPTGSEFNFTTSPAAAAYVFANWPTSVPIYSHGFSDGNTPKAGGPVNRWLPATVPVAIPVTAAAGRESWDIQTPLHAAFPAQGYFATVGANGTNTVDAGTGANSWAATPHAGQNYVAKAASDDAIKQILDDLILKGMAQ